MLLLKKFINNFLTLETLEIYLTVIDPFSTIFFFFTFRDLFTIIYTHRYLVQRQKHLLFIL